MLPEGPEERWTLNLGLVPGENRFFISSIEQGVESEALELGVIYDDQPPNTRVSPPGGTFLRGLTLTAASDEPATVYYTTDGGTPDEWSESFYSMSNLRVFDDTTFRFRARDLAGNWEEAVVEARFEISGDGNGWHPGGQLSEPRAFPAVASDGLVIYALGGQDGGSSSVEALRYDPQAETWEALPPLLRGRAKAAATLHEGWLCLFGGEDEGLPLNTHSCIQPGLDEAWIPRPPMPSQRSGLAAIAVAGRIHTLGGAAHGGVALQSHEVYDPQSESWSGAAPMPRPRVGFAAVEHEGRVYLLGGADESGTPIPEVDIYVAASDEWEEGPLMLNPRAFLAAALERNLGAVGGRPLGIIAAGGLETSGRSSALVEELELDTGRWLPRTPLDAPRYGAGAASLKVPGAIDDEEAQIWLVGGLRGRDEGEPEPLGSLVYYSHARDYVRQLSSLPEGRLLHAAVVLNEEIYLFGGQNLLELREAWRFDPETESFEAIAPLPSTQSGLAAVAFQGQLWAMGGASQGEPSFVVQSYDPIEERWIERQPLLTARRGAAALVNEGRIYVMGGDNQGALQSVEIYDPETGRWAPGPLLPEPRVGAGAFSRDGIVHLVGGLDAGGVVSGVIYRLDEGWSQLPGASIPVAWGSALLMGDHQLNVFAGRGVEGPSPRIWSYHLGAQSFAHERVPASKLLLPLEASAAAALNGEIYLFGGSGQVDDPRGEIFVQKLAGRCFNGRVDPYESFGDIPTADTGGGCGFIDPYADLPSGHGWGAHGSCGSWNDCGSAAGCATRACAHYGYGEAANWESRGCRGSGLQCDIFYQDWTIDANWLPRSSCDLLVAYNVRCWRVP